MYVYTTHAYAYILHVRNGFQVVRFDRLFQHIHQSNLFEMIPFTKPQHSCQIICAQRAFFGKEHLPEKDEKAG